MLSLSPAVKIYVAAEPADMRKSVDGLQALVEGVLAQDPTSGHLFLFRNYAEPRTMPSRARRTRSSLPVPAVDSA